MKKQFKQPELRIFGNIETLTKASGIVGQGDIIYIPKDGEEGYDTINRGYTTDLGTGECGTSGVSCP